MSVINMARNLKQVHPDFVMLYAVGTFYQSFGKDAYIVSYNMGYKIRAAKGSIPTVGFPKNAISKVKAKLEREKINFMLLDTRNNYDVDEVSDNGNLNRYDEILKTAHRTVSVRRRLDDAFHELVKRSANEDVRPQIEQIERIAYENRKV